MHLRKKPAVAFKPFDEQPKAFDCELFPNWHANSILQWLLRFFAPQDWLAPSSIYSEGHDEEASPSCHEILGCIFLSLLQASQEKVGVLKDFEQHETIQITYLAYNLLKYKTDSN